MVKRYNICSKPSGDWCKDADVKKLEARIKELEIKLNKVGHIIDDIEFYYDSPYKVLDLVKQFDKAVSDE